MIRSILRYVAIVLIGTVLGGILAALADMWLLDVISGTVLGPGHPDTALVWTAIGVGLTEGIRRWI